jgi:hypothetical protein
MTDSQALLICRHIQAANYGSFVSALSCAYLLADSDNRLKLIGAFSDLFSRIEADIIAYAEFTAQAV